MPRLIEPLTLAVATLGLARALAQPAPLPMDMAALFYEDTVATSADVCAKRVPASSGAWAGALRDWQRSHSTELVELRQLVAQTETRLREPHATPRPQDELAMQVLAARMQAVALPLQALATASDREAGALCTALLGRLADARSVSQQFASARAAAQAVLAAARPPAAVAVNRIQAGDLSIGGIHLGQDESSVTRRLGPPQRREDTGEGARLVYPGLEVMVGAGGHGVMELTSTGARHCAARNICPGMPLEAATRVYGPPQANRRETGEFFEYQPEGSTCWLQLSVSAPEGIIRSVRVACQP